MTRLKILKMKFFIYLLIYLLAQIAICDGNSRKRNISEPENTKKLVDVATHQKNVKGSLVQEHDVKVNDEGEEIINMTKSFTESATNESNQSTPLSTQSGMAHMMSMNSGALLRGFYVFVGLSILVMAYIVFRSFRLNKTRAQMVRKYGILAHRQDVEMRPLPLEEEDDDDTTVFDASIVLTREPQHQNV